MVYMQGLKTPGHLTDPKGERTGWQRRAGDQGDRDRKFFDAVWADLQREYDVDKTRVYATGHSNGGNFTYQLWRARPEVFAAFAPSSAVAPRLVRDGKFVPKPAFLVAGREDMLVKFSWQEKMIAALRRLNQCGTGEPWKGDARLTLYLSSANAPLVIYMHPGGHKVPKDAPELIVKFFQEHPIAGITKMK